MRTVFTWLKNIFIMITIAMWSVLFAAIGWKLNFYNWRTADNVAFWLFVVVGFFYLAYKWSEAKSVKEFFEFIRLNAEKSDPLR